MLVVYYGEDVSLSREAAREHVKKDVERENSRLFSFDIDTYTEAEVGHLKESQPLFGGKNTILLTEVLESDVVKKGDVEEFAASSNLFVAACGDLSPERIEALKKDGARLKKIEIPKKAPEVNSRDFNVFALTDALLARDRKRGWLLFHEALLGGIAAQEILFKYLWAIKGVMAAKFAQGEMAAFGFAGYPATKSLQAAGKYTGDELRRMYAALTKIYHENVGEGEAKTEDLEIALESFILRW